MSVTERRKLGLQLGTAFWLMGMAFIFGGHPQWAWMPICWGGFALGYRYALLPYEPQTPTADLADIP